MADTFAVEALGLQLLQAVREMKAGQAARFTPSIARPRCYLGAQGLEFDPREVRVMEENPRNATLDRASVAATVDRVRSMLSGLEKAPPVIRLESELKQDSNGRAMAAVVVVLKDHPKGKVYPWNRLRPINELILQEFNKDPEGPWPFIEFWQESELDAEDDPDLDSQALAG